VSKIKTIYICNHAHTDIGFTDYQELALRQHGEFVGQALDLIEKTD
jgi:alpha-mannosidase